MAQAEGSGFSRFKPIHGTKDHLGNPITIEWQGRRVAVAGSHGELNQRTWSYNWDLELVDGTRLRIMHMLSSETWFLVPDGE